MEHLNQVRTVLVIQVLHSFVSGVLAIALPLMMKERNIDIVVMGLVFASLPLIMQFGRMVFATFSDFWGRKPFFVSSGVLGVFSALIYYFAYSPVEFLLGKVVEGVKQGSLWAVNRPFLLEKSGGHWRILVYLRAVLYVAFAVGSLLAGFFVIWFLYDGTMMLCAVLGGFVFALSLLLVGEKRKRFSMKEALHFLDFRKKKRLFKIFLILFFVLGLSYGFRGGFVIPLFLDNYGFTTEMIGLVVGVQTLLAGICSYLFSRSSKMRMLILLSGILYCAAFSVLGFLGSVLASILVIAYGLVEGMTSIGQEGILSKITDKNSYGTDIGLLMMGLHLGETFSLALSGLLISMWGFVVPFSLTALTYGVFSVASYAILRE
ncbi:MAG: MFS transporter [Candidatus Bathyarchaeota archaeon]|nr:MAG: MFS transporter [Candidatus Bathyarchaeota archaeon]